MKGRPTSLDHYRRKTPRPPEARTMRSPIVIVAVIARSDLLAGGIAG